MRKILAVLAVIGGLLGLAAPAQADVAACSGLGLLPGGAVQYGTCTSTNPSAGTSIFGPDGSSVVMTANGPSEAISFWSSNGPVAGWGSRLCVKTRVDYVRASWRGAATSQLMVSANGASLPVSSWNLQRSYTKHCVSLPAGATNVWWQLTTKLDGDRNFGQSVVSQALTGVSLG